MLSSAGLSPSACRLNLAGTPVIQTKPAHFKSGKPEANYAVDLHPRLSNNAGR